MISSLKCRHDLRVRRAPVGPEITLDVNAFWGKAFIKRSVTGAEPDAQAHDDKLLIRSTAEVRVRRNRGAPRRGGSENPWMWWEHRHDR